MAEKTHTCGSSKVTILNWDDSCTWLCICDSKLCSWAVHCRGKMVTTGEGKPRIRPAQGTGPIVQVDGKLGMVAKLLQERWGRRVTVVDGRGDQRISRRLRGTRKEIADGLGLKLGARL